MPERVLCDGQYRRNSDEGNITLVDLEIRAKGRVACPMPMLFCAMPWFNTRGPQPTILTLRIGFSGRPRTGSVPFQGSFFSVQKQKFVIRDG
jgi:hypothetical protein